jgi:ATP-dependent DNA helicase PIF1
MDIQLTEKQYNAFKSMKKGNNVFLTGPAGCGKSFLLKYFIEWYKNEKEDNTSRIFITSTTGLSSLLIDGMTINRFSGIGTGEKDIDIYIEKINKMKSLRDRWKNTGALIIDEISMMNPDIFDKLEICAKKIRSNDLPFGGIQIIVSGDFLQLPPVKCNSFCFDSFSWDFVIDKTFYFDKIIRQDDIALQNILNDVRIGVVNEDVINCLNKCLNKDLNLENGILPTLLFSRKNMVIDHNSKELNKLIDKGAVYYTYQCSYDFGKVRQEHKIFFKELLDSQYQVDDNITYCINSQVMLTVNMPESNLANGSIGKIIDFVGLGSLPYPVVQFLNGVIMVIKHHEYIIDENDNVVKKLQIPLILSWAITIHKAQGMSLDYVKTDIGNSIFEYGQAYVVLSRIKNIEGLSLININYGSIKAHPKVLEYYSKINY